MGANHTKVAGESPNNATVKAGTQRGYNTGSRSANRRHKSPNSTKPYEQGTDSGLKPKLRLKQFFKIANDLQDVPSTPIRDSTDFKTSDPALRPQNDHQKGITVQYQTVQYHNDPHQNGVMVPHTDKPSPYYAPSPPPPVDSAAYSEKAARRDERKKQKKRLKRRLLERLLQRDTVSSRNGKKDKSCAESYFSDGARSIVMEDIAPCTSVHDPKSGKVVKLEKRPSKVVRERFDHRVMAKYDVKALIGKGSFSRVVRAEERETRNIYAIKLISVTKGRGPFENELGILDRVEHLHIIQLHEVIRAPNRVYMVMEFANGGELYERIIAKGKFSEPETARSLSMVLSGLDYLHQLGITHRDLKPENLLYSGDPEQPDSRLLITDFGLAHQQTGTREELMKETCGTPEYIAPEVLIRMPYSNKVDLWALGVISYILLSGIMPFDSESRTRLYRQIIRGKYHFYQEFWSMVSMEAKGFVSSLLEVDPDDRLSAAEALRYPWMQVCLDSLRTSRESSRSESIKRVPSPKKSATPPDRHTRRRSKSRSPPHLDSYTQPITNDNHMNGLGPAHQQEEEEEDDRVAQFERTRSTRSIRSVARSDHTHRVNPQEIEKLCRDPEIRRLAYDRSSRTRSHVSNPTPGVHANRSRQRYHSHVWTKAGHPPLLLAPEHPHNYGTAQGGFMRKNYGVV